MSRCIHAARRRAETAVFRPASINPPRFEALWRVPPNGSTADRIQELIAERIRIDAELNAAGVKLTQTPDGVSWERP